MTIAVKPNDRNRSAHTCFPPSQAFLWLPGFAGEQQPYCSYNEFREHPGAFDRRRAELQPERDSNGAFYIPPFPVSRETHISWHTNVTPPYPYHPIPLTLTLSTEETVDLGRRVMDLLGSNTPSRSDPREILRNEYKCAILVALAEIKLLPAHRAENLDVLKSAS